MDLYLRGVRCYDQQLLMRNLDRNKYRWTREVYGKDYICSLDRKPDPRVEICLYVHVKDSCLDFGLT